jgi:hypothetical protein
MATPTKFGNEFLVNTVTLNAQDAPSVKALANGTFVVAWTDASGIIGDSFDRGIAAQLFHADGSRLGNQFLVNSVTTADQRGPDVAAFSDGRFVISWLHGSASDGDLGFALLRIFNADGSSITPHVGLSAGVQPQRAPRIAVLNDGTMAATVSFDLGANDGIAVEKVGDFVALLNPAGNQIEPRIAALSDGGYVVVWWNSDGADTSLSGQKFNADGTTSGSQFAIETTTPDLQGQPEVAALPGGGFVVVWVDDPAGASNFVVRARIFPAAGAADPDFVVNAAPAGFIDTPNVVTLADGRFMVAWQLGGTIRAQVCTADGALDGSEFVVNTTPTSFQLVQTVSLTTLIDGRVVVAWDDVSQTPGDISATAVRAQILDPREAAVNLVGTALGDEWVGTAFGDTMNGAGGNDRLDGGGGTDTAIFSGARAAYTIASIGSDFQVTGPDGTDLLKSFELAQFGDTTIALVPTFSGTSGNDSFTALPGGQLIDGLGGIDTITFNFALVDAAISWSGNKVIVDTASSHTEFTGFETFVFTDGTVDNADGNPLVDDLFYYARNHDVWNAHIDAELHYGAAGRHEDRDPNAFFDISFYRSLYPDVGGTDPLVHFDTLGWQQGRAPSLDFDAAKYLAANPDVAAAGVDPLWHFLAVGASEGRQPFALTQLLTGSGFDYVYYLQQNPDVAAAGIDPLGHFQAVGWTEGRDPNALFDTSGYLSTYTDVAAAGINPLDHYHAVGWTEGRDPSTGFDTTSYLAANPDVAAAQIDPLLHFLQFGMQEGRSPLSDGVWG